MHRSAALLASIALAWPAHAQHTANNSNTASSAHNTAAKIIVPLSVGSTVDTVARLLAPHLGQALGRAVVVENRPGASGMTGTRQVVTAAPDGATVGLISSNHVINPSIYKDVPFDAVKDITPIAMVGTVPLVLTAHPSLPAETVAELVALLKSQPGKYNLGSAGNGSTLHLAAELFAKETGVNSPMCPTTAPAP